MFFSAAGILLVFLLGALLGLEAALGAYLGFDVAAPDFIASPISFCALGAGAATSSSSSSSESLMIEDLPSTLAVVFLILSFLFFPSAAAYLG